MGKAIIYDISPEEVTYIQDHTFNFLYEKTLYWLFSERMPFLCPFLKRKKKERVALDELLEYCRNHRIESYPMTIRRNRLLTDIAACYEMLQMKRKGLLIKNNHIAKLIIEYTKYCLVNIPVHVKEEMV